MHLSPMSPCCCTNCMSYEHTLCFLYSFSLVPALFSTSSNIWQHIQEHILNPEGSYQSMQSLPEHTHCLRIFLSLLSPKAVSTNGQQQKVNDAETKSEPAKTSRENWLSWRVYSAKALVLPFLGWAAPNAAWNVN